MNPVINVSVIIPTYNRLWCLPQAIESCRNTQCSTEIIVIDDGSTDGTAEWLSGQKDIIIFKQGNLGKCIAVNKGCAVARGKYVKFLDSDDLLDAGSIDEQFELAETTNSDVIVSGYKVIDDNGHILREQKWVDCDDFIAQQLGECDSSHYSAYLFKKDFIADIPHRPDFAFRDDRLFVLETALKHPKVSVHNGQALLHRVHTGGRLQLTSGDMQIVQNNQHLHLYKKILQSLANSGELTKRRIAAANNIVWPLAHWIAKYNIKEALQVSNWIYQLDPGFIPPETGALGMMYKKLGFKKTEQILRFRRSLTGLFTK